jgi:hypothetical protein
LRAIEAAFASTGGRVGSPFCLIVAYEPRHFARNPVNSSRKAIRGSKSVADARPLR